MYGRFILLLTLCLCHTRAYTQFPATYKWTKTFDNKNKMPVISYPSSIKTDDSGNVFLMGMMQDTIDFDPGPGVYQLDTAQGKMFVVKLDALGNFKWAKNFGVNGADVHGQLCIDKEGNVICMCYSAKSTDFDPGPGIFIPAERSVVILKFDNNGNVQWVKSLNKLSPVGNIFGRGIATDESGNIYINGFVSGEGDFDPGPGLVGLRCEGAPGGAFLCKLDKDAHLIWAKVLHCATGWAWWGGYGSGSLALGANNDIYVTGSYSGTVDFDPGPGIFTMSTGPTDLEAYVSKFDADGNFIWARRMAGSIVNYTNIAVDPWDYVYISGTYGNSMDPAPGMHSYILNAKGLDSRNGFLMKLDSSGTLKWAKGYYARAIQAVNFMNIDRRGYIYLHLWLYDSSFLYNRVKEELITVAHIDGSPVMLKLDSAGKLLGSKILTGTSITSILYVSYADRGGNIYYAGSFHDTVLMDPGGSAKMITSKSGRPVYLVKLAQPIPVSLNTVAQPENCKVFPNPTPGRLTLVIDGFKNQATVTVLNLRGEQLFSLLTKESRADVDISMFPAGLYLVEVSDGQRNTYVKVMKQ
jgi:hypothetical protein